MSTVRYESEFLFGKTVWAAWGYEKYAFLHSWEISVYARGINAMLMKDLSETATVITQSDLRLARG